MVVRRGRQLADPHRRPRPELHRCCTGKSCAEATRGRVARRTRVTVYNTPTRYFEYVNHDLGIYAQDTWTLKRLTVSPGLRFDTFNAKSQGGCRDAGRFVPAFCRDDVPDQPNWNNISPRLAAVYDLFGNARTALKGSVSKYMLPWAGGWAKRYDPFTTVTDIAQLERSERRRHRAGQRDRAERQRQLRRVDRPDARRLVSRASTTSRPRSACSTSCCRGSRCSAATSIATSTTRKRSRIRC